MHSKISPNVELVKRASKNWQYSIIHHSRIHSFLPTQQRTQENHQYFTIVTQEFNTICHYVEPRTQEFITIYHYVEPRTQEFNTICHYVEPRTQI